LKDREVTAARGIGLATSLLFFLGVLFGYYVIAPLSLQFLGNYELGDVEARISVMSYMKTVASISLAAGLIFQLPVLVYFLAKSGLVTAEGLKGYRKHALVGILVVSAIITPPDLTSQILVSMPVLVLYEIGIAIARRVERKAARA
jgi:sec-independent protein translocase protein TatC